MGARTYVRHPESGAVREVAASALRMLVRSGWQELTDDEVAALHEQRLADRTAAEAAMTRDRDVESDADPSDAQRELARVDLDELDPAAPAGDGGEHDDTAPEARRRQDTEQESD
jgi:hypothetical protein